MSKSKKYFYLSFLLLLISLYLNSMNPLLNLHFNSVVKIIVVSIFVNAIVLIFAIIFADKSIKHLPERKSWIHKAAKLLPWLLFIVLIIHILTSLLTFGII
ncbi:hypothetical protein [Staphylococcus ratti]|uniref:Uncharacterized protein n=1 Tax=Staphylococcus ratti TaxID=2892440 RepID=A0ABY3PF27_9STAP|nr:hypothetical protein [Staphylococcus ratti]UEX90899.1 hypothetical protein LN051_04590 [Staphylococcus ratti]